MHSPRLGVMAALAAFAIFLVILLFVREDASAVQVNTAQVPEADRWRYTEAGRAAKLAELRDREQKLGTTYGWNDQAKGELRIPITAAMDITLKELNAARGAAASK